MDPNKQPANIVEALAIANEWNFRRQERNERWEKKWAEQDKQRAAAQCEQALKDRALEWMRRENPGVVKEWEDEL